jgi:hypothetical protein
MTLEVPNFGAPDNTLIAVTLGALLATLGGFMGARLEAWIQRHNRERDAALLLGEILFTFVMLLKMAGEARAIGDPYGPITLRMLHGARREADAYERNRERLPDLRDGPLRIETHKLMISLTMSVDGIIDTTSRLEAAAPAKPPARTPRKAQPDERDGGFDFILETLPKFEPVIAKLSRAAKVSFDGHEAVARG